MEKFPNDNVNVIYTKAKWTGVMRSLAPFLYTERIHYHHLFKYLESKKFEGENAVLLDVGFGSGYNIEKISKLYGIKTIGADIVIETVDYYNEKKNKNSHAVLIDPNTNKIILESDSVDMVVCSHVLEHVPDDELLLGEIKRVLKENGLLYVNVPINEEVFVVENHLRKYSGETVLELLKTNNFRINKYFESDNFSRIITMLALRKSFFSIVVKKILIFILSIISIDLLESFSLKKSQFICFCTKQE